MSISNERHMKTQKYIIFILWMVGFSIKAQPVKIWSKLFGGQGTDVAAALSKVNDSLYLGIGKTASVDIPGYRGGDDFMACAFSPDGKLFYKRAYGSSTFEQSNALIILPNGVALVGGYSSGKGGDVSNFYGLTDMWLMAINPSNGMLLWEKIYGGTNNDQLNAIHYLEAGRVYLAGHTKSIDRDVNAVPSKGGNDILVAAVSEAGILNKVVTFGGTKDETAKKVLNAEEFGGQMLVFGESESNDLDFASKNKGKKDIFILKVNRNLNKISLMTFGGPGDEIFNDAVQLKDKTYMMFGTVSTKGGLIDTIKGGRDIWIVHLDVNGNILKSKVIGGSLDDVPVQAKLDADGNVILACNAISNDKDISITPYGGTSDLLIMKIDTGINILWKKYYGGTKGDNASALSLNDDGTIFSIGSTFSTDHDLSSDNKNPPDFWTQRLFECRAIESDFQTEICAGDTINILGEAYFLGHEQGTDTLFGGSYIGCDSIVHVKVNLLEHTTGVLKQVLCIDSSIVIHNVLFDKNHLGDTILLTGLNSRGCDSILYIFFQYAETMVVRDTLIIKDNGSGNGCIGVQIDGSCEPYKYLWSTGWTGSSNCNLKSGNYTLTVTDCNGCRNVFDFFLPSTVGTHSEFSNGLKVLNTSDQFIFISNSQNVLLMDVFDIQGHHVRRLNEFEGMFKLERKSLLPGTYWIRFLMKSGQENGLLIVN